MNNKLKILYNQCKALQNTMNNASTEAQINSIPFATKYNQLRTKIIEINPSAGEHCNQVNIRTTEFDPRVQIGYWNEVNVGLNSLVTYLEEGMDRIEEFIDRLINLLKSKLRPIIREKPTKEKEVQDKIEDALTLGNYNFLREKVTIPYSSKSFVPDFTFDNQGIALEVKLCNRENKEQEIIDEINADIKAYKTRYKHLIFIVYDNGFIRDTEKFRQDISNDLDIYVEVIKH